MKGFSVIVDVHSHSQSLPNFKLSHYRLSSGVLDRIPRLGEEVKRLRH
jgi:hypothetical protein